MSKLESESISLIGTPIFHENAASAAINPGMLVEYDGTKVKPQSTAKADCRLAFALENAMLGKSIETAYKVDDNVFCGVFHSGQAVNTKVAANAPAISTHDALEAAGNGTVRKHTDGVVVGYALADLDNSSNNSEVFLAMEIK